MEPATDQYIKNSSCMCDTTYSYSRWNQENISDMKDDFQNVLLDFSQLASQGRNVCLSF